MTLILGGFLALFSPDDGARRLGKMSNLIYMIHFPLVFVLKCNVCVRESGIEIGRTSLEVLIRIEAKHDGSFFLYFHVRFLSTSGPLHLRLHQLRDLCS